MRLLPALLLCAACHSTSPMEPPDAGVPFDAGACPPVALPRVGDAGYFPYAHAHNDYEHPRPLLDALDARFYSVEADLWLRDGGIAVSHDATTAKGLLDALYLDPLQARVTATGSVYGDGVPFVLWLDLKDGSRGLRVALETMLARYPMLTVYEADGGVTPGAVTAVLTGSDASKKAFVREFSVRHANRDQGSWDAGDAPVDGTWGWYAIDWANYMLWDGTMSISGSERAKLECLVASIHGKGARLRFWNNPETNAYRAIALDVGIDLIGTDELQEAHDFLQSRSP
ncbi:MAG: hypothetical protein IPJ65_30525 [Archangiaceae bacterium]|nr:hypothetical protein [Archangiaceae bacterium]